MGIYLGMLVSNGLEVSMMRVQVYWKHYHCMIYDIQCWQTIAIPVAIYPQQMHDVDPVRPPHVIRLKTRILRNAGSNGSLRPCSWSPNLKETVTTSSFEALLIAAYSTWILLPLCSFAGSAADSILSLDT